MKGLKIFTVITLAVLLLVGWVTFFVDSGKKIVLYQSNISIAEQYVEEGLYQRAILKYKEALAQNDSEQTWTKMFEAYELRYQEDKNILSDYITDLKNALLLYPKNVDFTQKLYELNMSSGDLKNAYACLNTAMENGVKDEKILKQIKELKYSYKVDYNTYSDFKGLSASSYAVSNGVEWGYIDTSGEKLADFKYAFASSLNSENIRIVETTLGSRLLDGNGMVLGIFPFTVTDAGIYANDLIPVSNAEYYSYFDSFAKEQFGGYAYAGSFQNGIAAVQKDGQWFLIDTKGNKISDYFADIVVDSNGKYLSGEVMIAAKENGKYQMFDENGKEMNTFSASNMDICSVDGWIAFEKDGKWGFVDTEGNVVIEPVYHQAKSFSYGLAAVCEDGKWGFINQSNELVIDFQFAGADYFNANGSCMIRGDAPNADDEELWQLLVLNFGV